MTVFWSAGVYASGSTWAYNVMRAVAAVGYPARVRTSRFANTVADLAGIEDGEALHVVKTHDLPAAAATVLLDHSPRLVLSVRDPRDAVTSLMRYQNYPFEQAGQVIARSARFVRHLAEIVPGALVLRYEDGFTDDVATVARIAEALGIAITGGAAEAMFTAHSRAAVERFIARLPDSGEARANGPADYYDPATQWHRHHVGRDGEVGRWRRMLMPGQPGAIEADCGDYMDRFGYARAPLHVGGYALKLGAFRLDI